MGRRDVEMSFFHRHSKRNLRQNGICHYDGIIIVRLSYHHLKAVRTLRLRVGIFEEGFESILQFLLLLHGRIIIFRSPLCVGRRMVQVVDVRNIFLLRPSLVPIAGGFVVLRCRSPFW
ncbi:hypothetical protein M413DRAFT_277492 [Hebeloma cylindrosporum]|uniref:Uncharacterized protein n=1 Tax=Hebeloma cylindrosporum TaxID=76867 RepID=A0A0C3C0X4_HEBCY|nr:hypothetical protein M413DRAFT_277492 [Hebeloma cylindrosporum h7]